MTTSETMSTDRKLCLLRVTDFRGKLYQRHYDHNVIIICNHKDDSFIEVLEVQQYISGHFSMILNYIHEDCICLEQVWDMGHRQNVKASILNKYFKNVDEIFEAIGRRTLKPTYVVTDDEYIAELIADQVPFYEMYPTMKLCQPKLTLTIEALCLEKPIDIRNPLHRLHLSGFFKKRKTMKFPVKKFLRDIPDQYVLFFALGTYRREYNYPTIISALYTLIKHAKHRVAHKVFVALGGNFNDYNIQDEENYHILLSSVRADFERFNILFLDRISTTDKKALLRRSNAMIYLNGKPGYNPDLRLSLSVGCPIITFKAGYAEHVIINGYSGFHMEKLDPTKLAVCMYKLIHPLRREYHSECARNHYIKEHTLTHYTLDSFREEDTPRPPLAQPKKERKDTKGRNKSKIVQPDDNEELEEPQTPLEPITTVEIEPKKRVLLYKSLSTATLYPHMNKRKLLKTPSLPNIKIDTNKKKEKAKQKKVKSPPKSPRKKPDKPKPKPKPKIIEEMDVTPRTRLLRSKSTSKIILKPKAPPKPPPRPAPKVYKRKPEPPSMIRAVGKFALKREMPKEEPPKDVTSKDEPANDKPLEAQK